MPKEIIKYEDFLTEVNQLFPDAVQHINRINSLLLENGCAVKLERSKSGFVVSYNINKTVILNFVFRKNGVVTRIYGDFVHNYQTFLESIPDNMLKAIEKAGVCKRLLDPEKCNPRCKTGYDFTLNGVRHQKCRFGSFMFTVDGENADSIVGFLENELKQRTA